MEKRTTFFNSRILKGKTTSIGLDIGSFSIKMAELSVSGEDVTLVNYVIKEFPAEARGKEKRATSLWAETIKEVIKQCQTKPDRLTVVLSGPSVAMKQMSLPLMPFLEIEPAIRWEGKKHFTFPLEKAKIAFLQRGEKEEEGVRKIDLLVAAAPFEHIDTEVAALHDILPLITGIDLVPSGLKYAFKKSGRGGEEETIALIHIGAEETSITILKNNLLQFSREISMGGNDLTQALTEPFAAGGKQYSLGFERAEEIKRKYGIPLRESLEKTEEGIPLSRIMFILRPRVEMLLNEITRSFNFYKIQLKEEKGIDRIFISGGSAKLKNFREYLASVLVIEIEFLDPFPNMALGIQEHEISDLSKVKPDLSLAIGLAIGMAQEVNLLPPQPTLLETIELKRYALYLFPFFFIILLVSLYYRTDGAVKSYQREITKIKSTFSALNVHLDKINTLKKEKEDLEKRLSVLPSLPEQLPYPEMILTISRSTPPNISLKRINLEGEKVAGTNPFIKETRRVLRLEGIVFGSDTERLNTLANFTDSLGTSPFFTAINLVSTGENGAFNQATDFTLLCSLATSSS